MQIAETINEVREIIAKQRSQGKKIALVPTMGYLHKGHLTLVEQACKDGAFVVMSIFVNPLQFGPNEDFARYPRDFDRDSELAQNAGVNLIFAPPVKEMYPNRNLAYVNVEELDASLCGASRPGHFRGVCTVVNKLFNIVQPDKAYFGQKDYQQCLIIKQMVKDLNMPLEVIVVPIVREEDGLALSSRNVYLSTEQRAEAVVLNQSLREAELMIKSGVTSPAEIVAMIEKKISERSSGVIDYIEIRSANSLDSIELIDKPIVIALAVRFGATRLIDNIVVEV